MLALRFKSSLESIDPFFEPHEPYIDPFSATLVCLDLDSNRETKLGQLEGYHFRLGNACNDRASLFDIFDSHSQEVFDIYQSVLADESVRMRCEKLDYFDFQDLVYVARLKINKPWRGRKLGLAALLALSRRFGSTGGLLLNAHPLEGKRDQVQAARKKLEAYYAKAGFRRISAPRSRDCYMLLPHALVGKTLKDIRFNEDALIEEIEAAQVA